MPTAYYNGTQVGYLINQARLPFFITSHYPLYEVKDNNLVVSKSDDTVSLQKKALEYYDLLNIIQKKITNNKRVTKTAIKKLESDGLIFITAIASVSKSLDQSVVSFSELVDYLKEREGVTAS